MSQIELHIGSTNSDAVIGSMIQAVYHSLNIDEVFQDIVRTLGVFLQADRCFISRFDENTGTLSAPTKEYRSSDDVESMLNANPELWELLTDLAKGICKNSNPVEFNEIPDLSFELQALLKKIGVQSGLATVIRYQNKSMAVLFIHQVTHIRHWTAFEKEIVYLTAIQSAVAIHHAELYESLQHQSANRAMVTHLYKRAMSGIGIEALFTQALDMIGEALKVEFGKIIEKTSDPEKPLVFQAVKGLDPQLIGQQFKPGEEPHANYTLEMLEPVITKNIYKENRFRPSPLHFQYSLTSGITAVIFGTDTPYGVLEADTRQERNFTEEDVYLMQAFANIIGLVIERKQAETILEIYQRKIEQSNKELERFATAASHDLKAPLRKISAFSSILENEYSDKLSSDALDYLKRITASADKMQTMITGLLELSSIIRQGKSFRPVSLNEVVNDVLADLESYRQDVHGTVEVDELCVIDGDESQLNQMLQNLIGNALKFHRTDVPPIVKVKSTQLPNGKCELRVQDNGIGLKPEYMEKIFEVFQRLHDQQVYEGSGIGLALVKQIVERHRGTIKVESTLGEGTTFIITLPKQQAG